ncbi:DMT family transporter [Sulfitobacter aestuariivivens]|uniref:DMT family transporter n=1 Tax=Sulfitobacter aestuariivivens TaxID=2766981 RepID=A0A927HFN0_9RHOB|nr:DMT family transporter [Sulfitobacter aestuariivivens]MBD3663415.1 DMT family transporter [Sulfitobacter aestuariivivens]
MDNLRGAALMVLSMLGFAIEDTFIKLMAGALPVGQLLVMLGCCGGAVFYLAVKAQGDRILVPELLTIPILLRAIGEFIGTLGFVSAIMLTPISTASAILQVTPLVVTLGAALFLGETVGWRRWAAILVGLFGVLLIIRPGMDSFEPLSVLALIGVFGLAMRDLATRRVPASTSTMQLSCIGFLAIVPGGAGLMAVTGTPYVMPDVQTWIYFTSALCIGLLAYYAIVAAMRVGDISYVTPFRYTRLLFALIAGMIVFRERPDALMLVGAAIIVGSGIYTVWRERKVAQRAAASLSKPAPSR